MLVDDDLRQGQESDDGKAMALDSAASRLELPLEGWLALVGLLPNTDAAANAIGGRQRQAVEALEACLDPEVGVAGVPLISPLVVRETLGEGSRFGRLTAHAAAVAARARREVDTVDALVKALDDRNSSGALVAALNNMNRLDLVTAATADDTTVVPTKDLYSYAAHVRRLADRAVGTLSLLDRARSALAKEDFDQLQRAVADAEASSGQLGLGFARGRAEPRNEAVAKGRKRRREAARKLHRSSAVSNGDRSDERSPWDGPVSPALLSRPSVTFLPLTQRGSLVLAGDMSQADDDGLGLLRGGFKRGNAQRTGPSKSRSFLRSSDSSLLGSDDGNDHDDNGDDVDARGLRNSTAAFLQSIESGDDLQQRQSNESGDDFQRHFSEEVPWRTVSASTSSCSFFEFFVDVFLVA
jgi:hypothetical protein